MLEFESVVRIVKGPRHAESHWMDALEHCLILTEVHIEPVESRAVCN